MKSKPVSFISAVLVFIMLLTCAIIASAAEPVPTNDDVIGTILDASTKNPEARLGENFQHGNYYVSFEGNRDGLYIYYLSQIENYVPQSAGVGVIDLPNRKILVPFKYADIQFLPDGNMFGRLYDDPEGDGTDPNNNSYYMIDIDGHETKLYLKSLPKNCFISYVDESGYATFCAHTEEGYYRMGLLNAVSDTLVLDAIVDSIWPGGIIFQDKMAIIQIGTTVWTPGGHHTASGNGKYGVIDREGSFIIPPEYDSLSYLGNGKFSAWIGATETVLDTNSHVEKPSSWAQEDVQASINAEIVPQSLQSKYTQATTRAEFCALAIALYENVTDKVITERQSFTDTNDVNIEKAAAIGVVSGVGNNRFAPNNMLTREQAATMLSRLANAIGEPLPKQMATFADNSSISSWAIESVGQMQSAGIMSGVGNNTFAPKSFYTREQSIATMLRLYNLTVHDD